MAIALVAGVVIAGVAVGAFFVVGRIFGSGWPSQYAPIAAQVATIRGLSFKHTVPIHFLADATFAKQIAAGDQPTTPDDRAAELRNEEELRALGLIDGSVDLVSAQTSNDTSETDGYYDEVTKQIYIRGAQFGVDQKVTLAHELTHALQDQYFNLTTMDGNAQSSGQVAGETALVEGDAVAVENQFVSTLPQKEQDQYYSGSGSGSPLNSKDSTPTSGALQASSYLDAQGSAPYVLGPDMVNAIASVDGNTSVDDAFRNPPQAEINFLDPTTYLARQQIISVPAPALGSGEKADGQPDDFGAYTLYLMLASRIDAVAALKAADGWGGDQMIQFLRGTQSCTRIDITGKDTDSTGAIKAALTQWNGRMPPGQVSMGDVRGGVELTACDPGSAAKAPPGNFDDALTLADEQDSNMDDALNNGDSAVLAQCIGIGAISDTALLDAQNQANQFSGNTPPDLQNTIDNETKKLAGACNAAGIR